MLYECRRCQKKAETLKMCAACSMVWYCNSECQKSDWPVHLVNCNPGRLITTADRLVAAVHIGFPPDDEVTNHDYGFNQSRTSEESMMRLEAYRILVVEMQVKAKTIHQWTEEGILARTMRETFDAKLPPDDRRQWVYQWLCANQSTFGRSPVPYSDSERAKVPLDGLRAAWIFIGGNPLDSDKAIIAAFRELPGDHQACFSLLALLLVRIRPYIGIRMGAQHTWINFGFCACTDPRGQSDLGGRYMWLLERVGYDTFYRAYVSSSLPSLFAENGLVISNYFILDVLSSRSYKSVWYLKEFVCTDDDIARDLRTAPPIGVDYGFSNCQNVGEVIALRNAYKQVFMRSDVDPLTLHEACLRGELFEYIRQLARLKPAQLFKRLMKNPYPL